MRLGAHLLVRLIFLVLLINNHIHGAPLERSVSASRQFIAYGANTQLRGAICDLAEKTKRNLLGLLQQRDGWKTPIILSLQYPQANLPDVPSVARYFSQTGSGLKLQLDLTIAANVDPAAIQREVLRAILLEMIYRRQPDLPAGTVYVQPPEWLVEGVLAIAPGYDRAPLIEALSPVLKSDHVMRLDDFLGQNPMLLDSSGRLLFRAYSLVLLQTVMDEPAGPAHLAAYIENLSRASNEPLLDLKANFPILTSVSDPAVFWKSKVAALGAAHDYELLTFAETERRLKDLLNLNSRSTNSSGKPLQLDRLIQRKPTVAERAALRQLSQSLMLLAIKANPVMRPVVTDYQQIVELIIQRKTKGLGPRLAHLKSLRARIVARMNDIDDYMNWYEATKSSTTSGAFTGYLKAAEKSEGFRRRDPISVYLDALEGQFSN